MIKLLIVDDEQPARELIRHYLQAFEGRIEIIGEAENGLDAVVKIRELVPDLVLLDIQMPKLTGFEVLELLDEIPPVIFITAYDQFAIKAFENNAVDYILKPFGEERFQKAIRKAMDQIERQESNADRINHVRSDWEQAVESILRIAVKSRNQILVLPVSRIFYFEANGDYVNLYTEDGRFLKEQTMKYFETHLPAGQFARVHRSYIVNVDFISKIEIYEKETYRIHLKNGTILKASEAGYKLLKNMIK